MSKYKYIMFNVIIVTIASIFYYMALIAMIIFIGYYFFPSEKEPLIEVEVGEPLKIEKEMPRVNRKIKSGKLLVLPELEKSREVKIALPEKKPKVKILDRLPKIEKKEENINNKENNFSRADDDFLEFLNELF